MVPLTDQKNWVSNFDLKLWPETGLGDSSLLWNFQVVWLFLSYDGAKIHVFFTSLAHTSVLFRNTRKTEFRISSWNYAQKQVSMRVVYCKSFRSFAGFCPKIRTSEPICVKEKCKKNIFLPQLRIGTTKRAESYTINYSHRDLFLGKVSSRNSKLNSSDPWGEPRHRAQLKISKKWNISTKTS